MLGPSGVESPEYIAWSDAAINCRLPNGLAAGPNDVVVVVAELGSSPVTFTVTAPTELCVDDDSAAGKLVFNRTVTLRDEWARIQKRG